MFTLDPNFAATLLAFGGHAWAQTAQAFDGEAGDDLEVYAVAPTPVSTKTTLVTAAPTIAEKIARSYQSWLTQANKPYANQLGTGNCTGIVVGMVDSVV